MSDDYEFGLYLLLKHPCPKCGAVSGADCTSVAKRGRGRVLKTSHPERHAAREAARQENEAARQRASNAWRENPAPHDYHTVASRCVQRKISLEKKELIRVGRGAAKRYRERHDGQSPPRSPEILHLSDDGPLPDGLISPSFVFAYGDGDVDLLDAAIDQVLDPGS